MGVGGPSSTTGRNPPSKLDTSQIAAAGSSAPTSIRHHIRATIDENETGGIQMDWSWTSYLVGLASGLVAFWTWALLAVASRADDKEYRQRHPSQRYEKDIHGNVIAVSFPKETP